MTSILAYVNWKWCIGKFVSPHHSPLYRYKECPTPENYSGQQTIQAFKLDYDRVSKAISLEHQQVTDGIGVEFSTGSLPPEAKSIEMIGWHFCHKDLVNFDWGNLKPGIETEGQLGLEKKEKFRWVREKEGHIGGINRLWVIRGYFIGRDENNDPPCITVLCAYEDVARFLVDFIHSRLHLHEGWGATMLPGVKVLKFTSVPGSNDDSDKLDNGDSPDISDRDLLDKEAETNLIRIDIGSQDNQSMPAMTNGNLSSWAQNLHRCGIHVEIVRESEVIAKATIGGLIVVGDEEGQNCGMKLDWALVKVPGLQKQIVESWMDVNLVRTVSGEFRPVLIALAEPDPYTHVVIATPGATRCLRGVFVDPDAIVNIPESPTPYATGSWVFNAENGMLLGVLVAGCPELQEVYIIPAYEIIDDINRHYQDDPHDIHDTHDLHDLHDLDLHYLYYLHNLYLSVHLPNCHRLPRREQIQLHRQINEYGNIVKSFENPESLKKLLDINCRIKEWVNEAKAFYDISSSSYSLREEMSPWKSALSVLEYRLLREEANVGSKGPTTDGFEGLLKIAIQQPPLRCYNFVNETILAHHNSQDIYFLTRLWRCLMLCLNSYSLNDNDIPMATKSSYDHIVEREIRLVTFRRSNGCPGRRSPWDNFSITRLNGISGGIFPWQGHAYKHDFPQRTPIDLGRSHPLTAKGVLDRLERDLEKLITINQEGVEFSLPETRMSGLPFIVKRLSTDSNVVLFALKLTDRSNRFLVTLPPPSVGPSTSTQSWPSARDYPSYAMSDYHIEFSTWRLPFILLNEEFVTEESINEVIDMVLLSQIKMDDRTIKHPRRLRLRDNLSIFYLTEYRQYVEVIIYECQVKGQSSDSAWIARRPASWILQMVDEASAKKHLSPPFSAILDLED
uniref:Uncharacterized protein n=1 Tax=Gibberella zeae TaxID=5518 RepID=A0A4E9EC95_GIBZA